MSATALSSSDTRGAGSERLAADAAAAVVGLLLGCWAMCWAFMFKHRLTPRAPWTGAEVLHTDLLSRIITARNTVVFRLSRCSSLPK